MVLTRGGIRYGARISPLGGALAQLVAAIEDVLGLIDDGRPGRGECDLVAAALEDLDLQLVLELFDRHGKRGLRDVAGLGGAAEVALAGHGQNVAKFV